MADQRVEDAMTGSPRMVDATDPVLEAARVMAAADVGNVIVMRDDNIFGIVTDRDIAVRAVAAGLDITSTPVQEITSHDVTTIDRNATVDDAVRKMRENAVRRLPVMDGDRPIGIVSIGDLAVERDPESVLADISAAPPNR